MPTVVEQPTVPSGTAWDPVKHPRGSHGYFEHVDQLSQRLQVLATSPHTESERAAAVRDLRTLRSEDIRKVGRALGVRKAGSGGAPEVVSHIEQRLAAANAHQTRVPAPAATAATATAAPPEPPVVQTQQPSLLATVPVSPPTPAPRSDVPARATHASQWLAALTPAERQAVVGWSDGDHQMLTQVALRPAQATPTERAQYQTFLGAARQAPVYADVVWRGLGGLSSPDKLENLPLERGAVVRFDAPVSTSKQRDVAVNQFVEPLTSNGEYAILLKIHSRTGADISQGVSEQYLDQHEVLALPGSRYQVVDPGTWKKAHVSGETYQLRIVTLREMD